MGMPRKKSRKVEVEGAVYLWRMRTKTQYVGDSPLATTLTIQRDDERPGRVCQVRLRSKNIRDEMEEGDYLHRATLHPQDVRDVISRALKRGWDPSERGIAFDLPGQIELTDYEQVAE